VSSPTTSWWDTRLARRLVWFGELAVFIVRTIGAIPTVLRRHRQQVWQVLADVAFGRGLVAVTASTVLVCVILSASIGVQIGLEGYQGLQVIGLAPLAGFLSAFGNTRELAPLITAFGLAAQMGGRFTAQLGAMRISEEIDALEVMSVPSLPYLVGTRMVVALLAVGPLYLVALSGAYLATQFTVTIFAHQGAGTYLHYFHAFLSPSEVGLSVVKVLVFAAVVTLVHCYYGFTATGGPEGVGQAAGRAIRASIVLIAILDVVMTLLFWGTGLGIPITG
jgi:phospholipid/cholesterol/gamma-HCH transport system permease protein